jgi:hypothetical protein
MRCTDRYVEIEGEMGDLASVLNTLVVVGVVARSPR